MWPGGWQWPEYRLEVDDLDWAVSEVASALESMRCPVHPVTADGQWWCR
jgi:2-amino-4-hydroxy-6-hydroxymethyldihydropteridine diphosphokinase